MNKRQRKKLENKLLFAIREGVPLITSEEILSTYIKIRQSKSAINRTLKDYKRFILKKR